MNAERQPCGEFCLIWWDAVVTLRIVFDRYKCIFRTSVCDSFCFHITEHFTVRVWMNSVLSRVPKLRVFFRDSFSFSIRKNRERKMRKQSP